VSVQHKHSSFKKGVIRIAEKDKGYFLYIVVEGMASDFIPFFIPLAGVALTAICCAIGSWCSSQKLRRQSETFHQRLLLLEQAPAKVIVHGSSSPVYYQPQPIALVTSQQPPQPKPSAPPSYPSYYPPYSSAYQGQQHPVIR
jgi:hypothetical protein